MGALIAAAFWATGVLKRPRVGAAELRRIAPLAVVHTLGNLLTNVSLGAVAVSFTHTIKVCDGERAPGLTRAVRAHGAALRAVHAY